MWWGWFVCGEEKRRTSFVNCVCECDDVTNHKLIHNENWNKKNEYDAVELNWIEWRMLTWIIVSHGIPPHNSHLPTFLHSRRSSSSISIHIKLILLNFYSKFIHSFLSGSLWMMKLRSTQTFMDSQFYPHRPGEPDCSYYIRTGLCRFGATCRFNHPPNANLVLLLCHAFLQIIYCSMFSFCCLICVKSYNIYHNYCVMERLLHLIWYQKYNSNFG